MSRAVHGPGKLGHAMALLFLLVPAAAHAANGNWEAKTYKYIIVDQDLREVLTEFGRNLNIPTQIGPQVGAQRVKGPLFAGTDETARSFLQRLCERYGLVWYFDGVVLHVSATDEIDTELIKLDRTRSANILKRLDELGLADPRFTVRVADAGSMLSVSGPPPYRSLVRKALAASAEPSQPRVVQEAEVKDDSKVRVFRGGR